MGRGKIEIRRIENQTSRQVTYTKRRSGILKKAHEITILCDAKVSVIIFSSNGKMVEYLSPGSNLEEILDLYNKNSSGNKLWDSKHENLSNEIDRVKKDNDNMNIELKHLNGEDITSLNPRELIAIDDALESGLRNIRTKKQKKMEIMEETAKLMDQRLMRDDYNSHMNFAFRVQPMQPNLQERM
uniref:MADS42 n=1 Tax=Hippophae rhamnoides TaxID=193516 RepID=A0AAU7LJG9_9ROSA